VKKLNACTSESSQQQQSLKPVIADARWCGTSESHTGSAVALAGTASFMVTHNASNTCIKLTQTMNASQLHTAKH